MVFLIITKAMKIGMSVFQKLENKQKKDVLVVLGMIFKSGKNT